MVDSCIMKRDGLVDIGQWTEENTGQWTEEDIGQWTEVDIGQWTEENTGQWTEGVETLVPSAPSRDLLSDDSDVS